MRGDSVNAEITCIVVMYNNDKYIYMSYCD